MTEEFNFGELEPINSPQSQPTIFARIGGVGFGLIGLVVLIFEGIVGSISKLLLQWKKGQFIQSISLDPIKWRDSITANGMPTLLNGSDEGNGGFKRTLLYPNANGKVLEIGAGTGLTLKYYNSEKISHIYLIEPCIELHDQLRSSIAKLPGLKGKTTILPYSIEEYVTKNNQFSENSFDTICLVQVLCSIDKPEQQISFLHSILKPKGQVLLFEHVSSHDTITSFIQSNFTHIWKHIAGNCHLDRDPQKMFTNQSGWQVKSLMRPKGEGREKLFPHLVAQFIKSSS